MPCRDPDLDKQVADREFHLIREKVNKLTRLLCGLLTKNGLPKNADPELVRWWRNHQEADKRRKRMEEKEAKREREIKESKLQNLRNQAKKLQEELYGTRVLR